MAILAWPGDRVHRHEIDEEAKTLKLRVRRKPVHRRSECGSCGRRLHRVHDVREREIRDLPWSVYRATMVVEVHRLTMPGMWRPSGKNRAVTLQGAVQ